MPSYAPPRKSVASIIYTCLEDAALTTGKFKTSPTIVAGDFKISKDGGAFVNLTTLPTVTPAGGTQVQINLSALEMGADNISILCQSAANNWKDKLISVKTAIYNFDNMPTSASNATAVWNQAAGTPAAGTFGAQLKTVLDATKLVIDLIKARVDLLPTNSQIWETPASIHNPGTLGYELVNTDIPQVQTILNIVEELLDKLSNDLTLANIATFSADKTLRMPVGDVIEAEPAQPYSLVELILAALSSTISGNQWSINHPNGTPFSTRYVTTSPNAAPMTGVSDTP